MQKRGIKHITFSDCDLGYRYGFGNVRGRRARVYNHYGKRVYSIVFNPDYKTDEQVKGEILRLVIEERIHGI